MVVVVVVVGVNTPRTVKRDTRGAARGSRRKEREGESKKSARLSL